MTCYLRPNPSGDGFLNTACGQRERAAMIWSRDWDKVDCHRCWYYKALEIYQGAVEELEEH